MYKIEIINCQRILKERFGRPIVYLDHWALNDLSLNAGYKKRFVNVMNEQGGTLRLSSCNIEELINQGDTRQIDAIFEMIESIDCGFIDINFKEVIERENYLIKNPSVIENPSINLGLIHDYLMSKNWPLEWRLVDMISTVVKETSIQKQRTRGSAFADKMNWLIDFARNNHDCLKKVSKRVHQTKSEGQRYSAATRELVLMMYDLIIKNKNENAGYRMDRFISSHCTGCLL